MKYLMANKIFSKVFENRYINSKVEEELVEFKKEIEEKFRNSEINKSYNLLRTNEDSKSDR